MQGLIEETMNINTSCELNALDLCVKDLINPDSAKSKIDKFSKITNWVKFPILDLTLLE